MIDAEIVAKLQGKVYPKACWYNALETLRYAPQGSMYVEGACISQITMSDGSIFNMVIDHGWVETPAAEVWDITDVVFNLNAINYTPWLKLTSEQLLVAKVIKANGSPAKKVVRELLTEQPLFEIWFGSEGEKIRRDILREKQDVMMRMWGQ